MNINIWSDVRCPFCYIGKRKFEMALEKFPHKDKVNVSWQSFELDPNLETRTDVNAIDYISNVKGISREDAEGMHLHVTQVAKEVGLDFSFDKAVVANSFNAHRLIQFAKVHQKGNEVEEALFKAHFIEGKNIDDTHTLVAIGMSIGLEEKEVREVLASDAYSKEVKSDERQAQKMGIGGVPFFVLNNKYGVSGAQSPETFLEVLEESWKDFEATQEPLIITQGESCSADGECN
ncbi:MAG: DsbA family oxidoreductase [Ginsengibacter sp.]